MAAIISEMHVSSIAFSTAWWLDIIYLKGVAIAINMVVLLVLSWALIVVILVAEVLGG